MSASGTFLLFVYGTLKRGGRRHGPLAQETYLGEARTLPLYALHDLGAYPGLKECTDGGQVVHGELYEVRAELLPLDATLQNAYDPYAFIRDAWVQQREFAIYDGNPPPETLEEDFMDDETEVPAEGDASSPTSEVPSQEPAPETTPPTP